MDVAVTRVLLTALLSLPEPTAAQEGSPRRRVRPMARGLLFQNHAAGHGHLLLQFCRLPAQRNPYRFAALG
jgi:hypothetical protein